MSRVLISITVALLTFSGIADAQTPLRQSTSRVVRICGVVDQSDGITPVTTLALGTADEAEALRDNTATLDISGATFAAITGADGCYSLTLDTTATNTVGELIVVIQDDSLVLPVWREFQVVEEAVYDRDYAASATGIIGTAQTGDSFARLGAPAGASIAADLATIEGQTDDIGAAGAGLTEAGGTGDQLTAVVWNAAWDAEVQSEATDALNAYDPPTRAELTSDIGGLNDLSAAAVNAEVDSAIETYHLDHLLAADYDPASQPGVSTALLNEIVESDAGVSRFTVNALEQGPSGSGASAAAIADAVWDEAMSGHTTAGTAGDALGVDVPAILADTAAIPTFPTNFADLDIEASTGHVDVGYWNGTAISTALETSADIADAVLDEDLTAHQTTGSLGAAIGDGDAGAGMTEAGGTGDQLTAVPYNSAWDAEIQSEAADALTAYDPPTNAELTARTLATASYFDPAADTVANVTLVATTTTNTDMITAAAVNAEVDTAIETYHLDHLLAADYDPATPPGTSTALLNEIIESDAGVSRFTINALEQGPSGSGASAAAIADAVWTETLADHSGGAGSTAEALDGAGGSGASASAIADAVLDEALSGHTTAGTLGAAIADIETDATAILADTNELQTDDVPTLIGTAQADLDILTGTDGATLATAQANYAPATAAALAALNDLSAAEVNAEVDTALSDYDPPTRAELTSDIAGLNDPTAAAIAAAVMASTCEDQGSGYTVQECLSILLAEAAGTAVYTTGSRTWVVSDPSGTEPRLTLIYGSDLDGDRSSSTPAPMTP